ncbi:MAG TPA: sigma-54 dependent transcriptional regulator [Longimicrobium sp.]|jgi:DNA-binding NtrC family response regulator|uniref:sigma-54-dependent transcriptional regulator n=1 Tax=Longimicrobium sp. TaxID=2029185 RepID=UPI002ED9AB9A
MTEAGTEVKPHLLLVEDEASLRDGLSRVLGGRFRVTAVGDGPSAVRALERELFDLVLLDINLPGLTGVEVLRLGRGTQTDAQFVMMTGFGTVQTAVEAIKLGAFDYLNKPVAIPELLIKLERALEQRELGRELALLRGRAGGGGARDRIIGRSPAMVRMFTLMERVAATRANVLITGETGTGKELVARGIHELSDRARRPFVPINCSALPETLLESELFGHVKGAFTGAAGARRGLFEEAAGGTVFLDEVGTLAPATQARLLRVLQERTIQRLGDSRPVPVDFRLVAAGNLDLQAEMEAGRFRDDLFYRLNVFPLEVPPLRARREDIPLLAQAFRERFMAQNGTDAPRFSPEALERLAEHDWPGNVRELENLVERALILHAGMPVLPLDAVRGPGPAQDLLRRAGDEVWPLDRLEREYVHSILDRNGGRMGDTAQALGIDPRTLTRKIQRWRDEEVE